MTNTPDHTIVDNTTAKGEELAYSKPKLRKIRLAAEEVLTTGCKIGGVCDVLGYPNPTGAGS